MRNPYEVLGVSVNSTDEEIKKAKRRLSMKYHPDSISGGDTDKLEEVLEAYSTIMSQRKNGTTTTKSERVCLCFDTLFRFRTINY